jgi:hypothetical protein
MVNNPTKTNNNYRWLGLAGVILLIAGNWFDSLYGTGVIDPVSRLLFLIFSVKYWQIHKDSFSIILIVCTVIIFLLGLATLTQVFISPNLL